MNPRNMNGDDKWDLPEAYGDFGVDMSDADCVPALGYNRRTQGDDGEATVYGGLKHMFPNLKRTRGSHDFGVDLYDPVEKVIIQVKWFARFPAITAFKNFLRMGAELKAKRMIAVVYAKAPANSVSVSRLEAAGVEVWDGHVWPQKILRNLPKGLADGMTVRADGKRLTVRSCIQCAAVDPEPPHKKCLNCRLRHRMYTRADYARHTAAGKCTKCGGVAVAGKTLCEPCAGTNSQRMNQNRWDAEAAGMCNACGKVPPRLGMKTCGPCAERKNGNTVAFRARLAEKGICKVCCMAPADGGGWCCAACHIKENERNEASRQVRKANNLCKDCGAPTDGGVHCAKHKVMNAARCNQRHRRLKAEGRCVSCGRPAPEGRSTCLVCGEKNKERNAKVSKSETTYHRRKAAGLCTGCGGVPAASKLTCVSCAEKSRASCEARRLSKNEG